MSRWEICIHPWPLLRLYTVTKLLLINTSLPLLLWYKPLNAILKETTPFIELSSVYVSKLGFNVSSFTNLKKKPIEVSIDEVHVLLVEPLSFKKRNWSWDKWSKKIVADALKRGSYGLLDRIGDNITLEVNRAYITLQPMGRWDICIHPLFLLIFYLL